MYTLKLLALTSLFAFPRYDAAGGCVANFAQSAVDMSPDLGSGLQVSPARISVLSGATLQVSGGMALAGQSVQLKQGAVAVALGTLDAQGQLQKALVKADLAALALGPAQVVAASGTQVPVRLFIEPKLDNAPALYPVGRVMKADPTPVWIGVAQKKILTLNFYDSTGMSTITQSVGEYGLDIKSSQPSVISVAQPIYSGYSRDVFPGNYSDVGIKYEYTSTGIGLTLIDLHLAESKIVLGVLGALIVSCPLGGTCMMTMLAARPYSRITSLTADRSGALFAAIVTASGMPPALRAFSEGTLGTAINLVGGNTALPHETMLGAGRLSDDDSPDLIALSATGTVSIWQGGSGQLTASDALTAAVQQALNGAQVTTVSALGVGDLDGDGLDDLVVASNAQVVMLINQGGGRFSALSGPVAPAGLAPVTAIAIGDVSVAGKGIADLVLASQDQHSIGAIENSAGY